MHGCDVFMYECALCVRVRVHVYMCVCCVCVDDQGREGGRERGKEKEVKMGCGRRRG